MTDSAIASILEAIDPEDYLIELGVEFRSTSGRSGPQLNIKTCPRCGGSKWKVFLGVDTGLGNCFHGACSGLPGFNLFTFAQSHLNLSAKETFAEISKYAKRSGWKPKRSNRVAPRIESEVRLPPSIPLRENNALPYLTGRGFSGKWQEYFEWRFCAYGSYPYTSYEGEQKSQDYSNRVIIPVRNIDGKIVTFQGRDVTGTQERKYLFPPMLPGTGMYLYNAWRAMGSTTIIICEGVMDVAATTIALRSHGIPNVAAVGSFGLSLSGNPTKVGDDQYSDLMALKRAGATKVVFMWDGEKTALISAIKEVQRVAALGLAGSIAILPKGCDPNEIDAKVLIDRLERAVPATADNLLKLKMKAMAM
jgi:DNA primase